MSVHQVTAGFARAAIVYNLRDPESELQQELSRMIERQVSPFAFPYVTQIWAVAAN